MSPRSIYQSVDEGVDAVRGILIGLGVALVFWGALALFVWAAVSAR